MRHRLPQRTKIFVMRPQVTTSKPPQYAIAVPVNKGPGLALPIPIPIIISTEATTPATTTEETTLPMTTMAPNDLVQLSMFNMWLCSCHVNKCVQFAVEHSESWDSFLTKCIMGFSTLSLSINMKNCKLASWVSILIFVGPPTGIITSWPSLWQCQIWIRKGLPFDTPRIVYVVSRSDVAHKMARM